MTGVFANRLFRIAFTLAGLYNLAFGLWAALWPQAFFNLFALPPPRYPGIWACLGMVVGVYGVLYLHAAWKLETATPVIAIGLLGKVLGPIGMVCSFSDAWPKRVGMICVFNDLIWWLPFALFLIRSTTLARRLAALAPWLCIAAHVAGLVMLMGFLRYGIAIGNDNAARAVYIAGHPTAWALGWGAWMLAAASLVGFYAWWGSQLRARRIAIFAVMVAALGMVCDFGGESLLVLLIGERAAAAAGGTVAWAGIERTSTLLSAGMANGLYTLGGAMLTWATPNLPTWVRATMWATWLAGAIMTLGAVANHVGGIAVSSAVLFPTFIAWTAWMGARWRQQ